MGPIHFATTSLCSYNFWVSDVLQLQFGGKVLLIFWVATELRDDPEAGWERLRERRPAPVATENVGFVPVATDGCEQAIGGCVVCLIVGRPYGLCDPHCGAVDIRKPLSKRSGFSA